jgi:hypothetical protein
LSSACLIISLFILGILPQVYSEREQL